MGRIPRGPPGRVRTWDRGDAVVGLRLVVYKAKGGTRWFFCFRWRSEIDEGWSEG
jgi:hypothetical protein